MKRNIAKLIVAALVSVGQGATAQESLISPAPIPEPHGFEDLPAMIVPNDDFKAADAAPLMPDPASPYPDSAESIDGPLRVDLDDSSYSPGETVRMLECQPAFLESSGTWLRRGFWYAEIDAVILNRSWNADTMWLATEQTDLTRTPLGALIKPVFNGLGIDETDPGAEGLPRLTLGKFFFRDGDNRDHSLELTWYGGGQWTQRAALQSITSGGGITDGLQVPSIVDGNNPANPSFPGNPSFDGAMNMDYRYDTHMDSVEVNYIVRQRMRRDQMILKPDGGWVRRATPSRTLGFTAGVRFMNLREALAWNASGMPDNNGDSSRESGRYFVATDNNLIGTQLGASVAHEASRWSLGIEAKIGGYWNATDLNSTLEITGGVPTSRSNASDDSLSIIAEGSLVGKWHLTPRWSLRAGAELMWLDAIALAPHQLNFIPGGYDVIVDTGGNLFFGTSLGVESYW